MHLLGNLSLSKKDVGVHEVVGHTIHVSLFDYVRAKVRWNPNILRVLDNKSIAPLDGANRRRER